MENREKLLAERARFYEETLVNEILPYWLGKTDEKNGGFFTCYNVTGDTLVSRDKYVWSQGRCVWLYAKLALSPYLALGDDVRERCRRLASEGSDFLVRHCLLPDGSAAYVLDENNRPRVMEPWHSPAISSFADCFVAMGLAAAALLNQDVGRARTAWELLRRIARQVETNKFRTAPDVLPVGWRGQAPYMIMVNTAQEVGAACQAAGMEREAALCREICLYGIETERNHFIRGNVLYECLDENFDCLNTLYGRHINPGHTMECMWFFLRAARCYGFEGIEETALPIIRYTGKAAWDPEYGGMFYYLDCDGGAPKGEAFEAEASLAEGAVRDWDNKMWWTQLETIYANLLGWLWYGDEECLEEYERYHRYTFATFPNPDRRTGEWIQIRDRRGNPILGEVGGRLPVKDPFHLMRTLLYLTETIRAYQGQK